jgi:hypothetical protein
MDYNTDRERLILPEYGRNVQNMVDYALTIKDRRQRQFFAETIVKVMGIIYPAVREMPDAENVLWDHLARMSRYELDIDYPVEITKEEVTARPKPLPYPMQQIHYRHYGHLLESLLNKLGEMPESAERDRLVEMAANQMRKDLYYYNKDALNEEKIAKDIERYTEGKIHLESEKCHFSHAVPNNNFQKSAPLRKTRGRR